MAHAQNEVKTESPCPDLLLNPQNRPGLCDASQKEQADGRTVRATGRTKQLATRVREEFYHELRLYAATHRLKLVEVFEHAFEALKKTEMNK